MRDKPGILQTAQALNCLPENISGSRLYGSKCPTKHGSENGRCFNIWEDTQSFYCFHCGAGGDSFELIKMALNCDFQNALDWAEDHGLITCNGCNEASYTELRKAYLILTDAAKFFHSNLNDLTHLKEHYGLSEETIQQYLIGYAHLDKHALKKHLSTKGHDLADIKRTGLLGKYGDSFFQGQIIFPYWNQGLVKYFIARQTPETPDWKTSKYEKLPTTDLIKNEFFYGEDSIRKAQEVYVNEGVTDCLSALQHGLSSISPVTTQFRKSDHPKLLSLVRGKKVFLVPDNEESQAGMKGAQETLSFLKNNGIEAWIITLPRPEGKEKIDFNEYIRDHGIEAFKKLVEEQSPPKDPKPRIIEGILELQKLVALELPERKKYLDPWLMESSINMICGPRGIGKTMLAFSIGESVARGASFGPWAAGESVNVLYLDGELVLADLQERANYFKKDVYPSKFYIYSAHHFNHMGLPNAILSDETWQKEMTDLLKYLKVKLWFVDNIASLTHGIDENLKHEWDPINQWFLKLRFEGINTTFLHHAGKEKLQRGTSGHEDNIDISIMLDWPKGYHKEDGCRFVAKFVKARIRQRDLHLIADTEFALVVDENNVHTWTFANLKVENKKAVLELLDKGLNQTEIAKILGISEGYVSKIKSQGEKDGLITPNGKLTQSGYVFIHSA
jgi:hypothetical protein